MSISKEIESKQSFTFFILSTKQWKKYYQFFELQNLLYLLSIHIIYLISGFMSFIKRLLQRRKPQQEPPKGSKPSMLVMESDTLGMTVVQQTGEQSDQILEITSEEWVQLIDKKGLGGVPYNRIYFSFLKGIPDFLRMKIWLMLCTEESSRNYKFTGVIEKKYSQEIRNSKQFRLSKQESQLKDTKLQNSQVLTIFTTELYQKLSTSKPQDKQTEQIDKDIHRSYSNKPQYKFTEKLLRKILYSLSNSGIQYSQGMNYILLSVIIYCLESLGINSTEQIDAVNIEIERDIFIINRQIVLRLEEVFDSSKIFQVMKELEEKISETVPEIFYNMYKMGMDTYSLFSQNYYSLLTYSDPPDELCKMMMDLFFIEGEKAITSLIVRMLEISQDEILKINDPEKMQKYIKVQIFHDCFKFLIEEKKNAKTISDFGISFYQHVESY